ncbi:MAG: ATP-binding protein [Candidatus Promineifilaceae bacterium]|nr:ATP-binding protein [Candidatus Promineifilaceae bacterium]
MDNQEAVAQIDHIHTLWEQLTRELTDVLDAHGVCAAVTYEIAVFTGVRTVVVLSGPPDKYFDAWICDGNGDLQQARWNDVQPALDTLRAPGGAVRQEKMALPAAEIIDSDLWVLVEDDVLFVPLPFPTGRSSNVPQGGICLLDPPDQCPLNQSNIETLATHITIFLDRAFLRQEIDRQQVEFDIVYDLTYSLTATLKKENILNQLIDPVRRILNVEAISIGLVEETTGDIIFEETLMGPLFQKLPPVRLRPGQGIAGVVAESGESLIINNVYKDERFFPKVDTQSGFRTESIICVPLQVEGRVIGILEAINKRNGNFNQTDLRLLQAIASPLAAAIENARLHGDVLAEKRRVETIFSIMPEGMLTVNAEGRVTEANEALLTLMGYQTDEPLVGNPASEVIRVRSGEELDGFMEKVREAHGENPQVASDIEHASGGSVPVLISGASIQDEEGELSEMIFVFSDLRQIRELERMRDDFFHNIVHELRTPLATILMYARLLREGKAQDDEAKADRFLGVIERESDRLQQMVRQMLQLAKMEAREIQRSSERVELNHLFDDLLPPLADRAVERGLVFSQKIQPELPPIVGSQEMIYSVLKNLVENAVKFTISGSVRVEAKRRDGMVRVLVQDEGIGIPEEAQPNLFKRFYRAQTAVERGIAGTGLGLYMVKEAVERHRGSIQVESVEGEGSTFVIELPAAEE